MSKSGILWSSIGQAAGVAIIGALVVNVVLYFIFSGLDLIPDDVLVSPADEPITLGPVIFATLLGTGMGSVVFTGLAQFTQNPVRIFQIVAAVVLLLSFVQPLTIADIPIKMFLALNTMHIVAGTFTIGAFTRYAKPAQSRART